MSESHLLIEPVDQRIIKITLNRPRQLNALASQTIRELSEALVAFENGEASVLILTGNGRAFCFGADFNEFENRAQLPALLAEFQAFILRLYECPKITIASLNGFATGAGFDLALACDFRIASDRAKVGEAYVSMGLVPDCGGSFFLPRMIGTSASLRLLINGESLSAADAKAMGLIDYIYPAEELTPRTQSFAEEIAKKPQTAVRLIKKLVHSADLKAALQNEREAQLICFEDPEHQTIVAEFLKKRR